MHTPPRVHFAHRAMAIAAMIAVCLSLFPGRVVRAQGSLEERYRTGTTTTKRGSANGTGLAITKIYLPAAPYSRKFYAIVDENIFSSKEVPVVASWEEEVSEGSFAKRSGPVYPIQTVGRTMTILTDRLKDGEHKIVIVVRQPGGTELYRSPEQTVEINEMSKMRFDYSLRLGQVDAAGRKATLTLKYPADPYKRKATVTTVYEPKVSCKSAIAKCAGMAIVPGLGALCALSLMRKRCDFVGDDMVQEQSIGTSAGSLDILVPRQSPTPKAGNYTSLVVVTDENDEILSKQSFEFKLGDDSQKGACSATLSEVNKEAGTAKVTFDYREEAPALLNSTYVKAFIDEREKFSKTVDDLGSTNVVDIPFTGLIRKRTYTAKIVLWDWLTGAYRCTNTLEIDMRTDPDAPPDSSTDGTADSEQTPFTWLSGKCIKLMEEEDIGAISCVISNTINFLLSLVGIVSTGIVVYGGFVLGTAQDDAGRGKGKKIITMALAGLVVVLLAFVIVQVILGGGIF